MVAGLPTDGWKLSLDDYVTSARNTYQSMSYLGFRDEYAPRIDPDGELLDGSHRVACAIALGIAEIPIRMERKRVWAPAWDYRWFVGNGCPIRDLDRTLSDYAEMKR